MSLPLEAAYAQNKQGWLASSPCANASDVYTCIYGLSVDEIVVCCATPLARCASHWQSSQPPSCCCCCVIMLPSLQNAIPPLWNPPSYFPESVAGNNDPALVIIDGVTLTLPLFDALHTGLVDVPLILTTMRDVRTLACA